MPPFFLDKRNKDTPGFVVAGDGFYAKALAQILGCRRVSRKLNDSGWNWPRNGVGSIATFFIIAGSNLSASRVIRWHGEVWQCPNLRQARCVVLVGVDSSRLRGRDVFGRTGEIKESFFSWSKHVAILSISIGLSQILDNLASLVYCPVTTWKGCAEKASVIPPLYAAITSQNVALLLEILPRANLQDWDAICCDHSAANRVRRWLASVTPGVTPIWEEGELLLSPLVCLV